MDKYEVKFPFVCKIQQLEKYSFIRADEVLFAYDVPGEGQGQLFAAFNEIKEQIKSGGVVMADIKQEEDIVKFATT